MLDPEHMLTADEVGEILGLHPATIRRGGVPGLHPIKVTRRAVRFRASDVQAVMEGRSPDAEPGEESDMPASERAALLSAAGNELVAMLMEENLMTVDEINDRLIPLLNKRWKALFESWEYRGDGEHEDDDATPGPGDHDGPGDDEHDDDEHEARSR